MPIGAPGGASSRQHDTIGPLRCWCPRHRAPCPKHRGRGRLSEVGRPASAWIRAARRGAVRSRAGRQPASSRPSAVPQGARSVGPAGSSTEGHDAPRFIVLGSHPELQHVADGHRGRLVVWRAVRCPTSVWTSTVACVLCGASALARDAQSVAAAASGRRMAAPHTDPSVHTSRIARNAMMTRASRNPLLLVDALSTSSDGAPKRLQHRR